MIQSDNSLLSYIAKQATYSVNGTLGENCVFSFNIQEGLSKL